MVMSAAAPVPGKSLVNVSITPKVTLIQSSSPLTPSSLTLCLFVCLWLLLLLLLFLPLRRWQCKVVGVGSCVPEDTVTNFDLEALVETSDEWIKTR